MTDKPPLTFFSAISLVAASMIGAGVYTTSGFTLADLGSAWWVMAAWSVAGLIAICGAICYGALARHMAESGGEYLFLSRKLHPVAGMMAGWVSLLAGFTGAIAFAATTFETYIVELPAFAGGGSLFESLQLQQGYVAIAVVVFACVLHCIGVRSGARVQDIVVVVKFLLIFAFLIFAGSVLLSSDIDEMIETAPSTTVNAPSSNPYAFAFAFATSLMWISLSYSGFNAAVYMASEVQDAPRNVPRALLWGTLLVTVCYLFLNAAFVLIPPSHVVEGRPDIATAAARFLGGEAFAMAVRIVILFGLFTSVSAMVMSGPRVYAKMADDGLLPKWFRFQGDTPLASIIAQGALAIVVIQATTLKQLLDYLGFTLSVSAALTVSLLFWIRDCDGKRVRTVFYPLPVILFVGGTILTATLSAIASPVRAAVGLGVICFGATLYPFYRSDSR